MSENVEASASRNPKDLHGLYRDNFTFTFYKILVKSKINYSNRTWKWGDKGI
jgi:hypothetical protein